MVSFSEISQIDVLTLVDVSSHVGDRRVSRETMHDGNLAQILPKAMDGAYLGARLPKTAHLGARIKLSSPGKRAAEVRGVASARSLPTFCSDPGTDGVLFRLMRGLPRAQEGPSWTQHLPLSALCSRTGASREAVRGLPFFHMTQSMLHQAQRR